MAIDALRLLSIYHADARPERSKKTDDRVDTLSRWPLEQKALYLEDGVPDGIGTADAFRGPVEGQTGPPGPAWAARISGGPSPSSATVGDQRPAEDPGHRLSGRQVVAAPGAGKFIQVRQLWIQKHGSDRPPGTHRVLPCGHQPEPRDY